MDFIKVSELPEEAKVSDYHKVECKYFIRLVVFGRNYYVPMVNKMKKIFDIGVVDGEVVVGRNRMLLHDMLQVTIASVYYQVRGIVGDEIFRDLASKIDDGFRDKDGLSDLIARGFDFREPVGIGEVDQASEVEKKGGPGLSDHPFRVPNSIFPYGEVYLKEESPGLWEKKIKYQGMRVFACDPLNKIEVKGKVTEVYSEQGLIHFKLKLDNGREVSTTEEFLTPIYCGTCSKKNDDGCSVDNCVRGDFNEWYPEKGGQSSKKQVSKEEKDCDDCAYSELAPCPYLMAISCGPAHGHPRFIPKSGKQANKKRSKGK